ILTNTFKGDTYTAQMNASRAGRQVYCVITDKYGNKVTSNTVTLNMSGVTITTQPQSVTVANGKTATVTVKATGEGLTYKWYYKNKGETKFSYTASFTGNVYSVQMNSSRAGRQVYCVITDKYGSVVQTVTVTLNMI
ncbi:MAG: immunoglobulin domain-containing protein, partial [Oscillospiraceae bacterium]|nr:immunoglobulin domain-containing protein [Oscillospiraceae bacterium]